MAINDSLDELHAALGRKKLSRIGAKLEIVLGLLGGGAGLLLGVRAACRDTPTLDWSQIAGALLLIVLGGYVALAGHRTHLYQSSNEQTAYLAEKMKNDIERRM